MGAIKISSKIDERAWKALQKLSKETSRSLSGLLTEAVTEYLSRRTVRQEVLDHAERSMAQNEELGRLLAK